jgi:hypothetical protein
VNDIIYVEPGGIRVRSHRTSNEDFIGIDNFRAWWDHLQQHGTAALTPGHANNPRADRAVLVGAILASCLPNRIALEGTDQIRLLSVAQPQDCPLPEELPADSPLIEGVARSVLVNAYERNPEARRRCVAHYGANCSVCGFNFGAIYGPIAEGCIHVHHLRPLSEVGGEYVVDPVEDLRPVCPNCHAVIHWGGGSRSIEEVKLLWRNRAEQKHEADRKPPGEAQV